MALVAVFAGALTGCNPTEKVNRFVVSVENGTKGAFSGNGQTYYLVVTNNFTTEAKEADEPASNSRRAYNSISSLLSV